jgi:hypothetical protein
LRPLAVRACLRKAAVPLLFAGALGASASCFGAAPTSTPQPQVRDGAIKVVSLANDIGVGRARLPLVLSLHDATSTRLDDRADEMEISYRFQGETTFADVDEMEWRAWPVRGGAYIAYFNFDRAGIWEIEAAWKSEGGDRKGSGYMQVNARSAAPEVGESAPASDTAVATTIEEARQISSAPEPDLDLYSISLRDALANGRPTVVLFATPAFCMTETCGPQLEAVRELKRQHGDRVDFIHVEIFTNAAEVQQAGTAAVGRYSPAVIEWNLRTAPWTFFIDAAGVIRERFEQYATLEELNGAIESVLN